MSMQIIVLSGLSGSGKTVALHALEDSHYFCVDNLPAQFLAQIGLSLCEQESRIAVSIDVRGRQTLDALPEQIRILREAGVEVQLLYLDANTDTLIKRFSETRRAHPLATDQLTIPECVALERALLEGIREVSHAIDTSHLSANALRYWVRQFVSLDASHLTVIFQSFGFKHGVPLDADFIFDARSLPNPYYDPVLRPLTGKDAPVIAFLENQPLVRLLQEDIIAFVDKWLPPITHENRQYVTVAIGCTGGQHRSVYLVEQISRYFAENWQVLVRHREAKDSFALPKLQPNHASF